MLSIRFWGVRGSIATGGNATAGVGGNTSCVEVRCAPANGSDAARAAERDVVLILDAGTGLRALGAQLMASGLPVDAHLLLSHFHWDHIQGFPFFSPAYVPGHRVTIYGAPGDASHTHDSGDANPRHAHSPVTCAPADSEVRAALARQMQPPHFPVGLDAMRATLAFRGVAPDSEFSVGDATVRTFAARHPGGCIAWRIDHGGRSLVYATDTEHDASGQVDESLLVAARGADVLIYDAQYTPEEYAAGKRGWGHSTAEEGTRLARAAGVGRLVLFHHDPSHDDDAVARIEDAARALLPSTIAAREGLELSLPSLGERVAA